MNRRHFLLSLPAVAVTAKAAEPKPPSRAYVDFIDKHHRHLRPFRPTKGCIEFFGTDDLEVQEFQGRRIFHVYAHDGTLTDKLGVVWQCRGARTGRDDFYTQTYRGLELVSETPYRMQG